MTTGHQLRCLRCGHGTHGEWPHPPHLPLPKHCPRCQSDRWNQEPRRKNARRPSDIRDPRTERRQKLPRPGGGWVWVWGQRQLKQLEQRERGQLRARQAKRRALFRAARKLSKQQGGL